MDWYRIIKKKLMYGNEHEIINLDLKTGDNTKCL